MEADTLKAETIAAYQKIAAEFNARNAVSIYRAEAERLAALTYAGARVLEIGCGTGRDAALLAEKGFAYTGIDASDAMLALARARLPQADFRVMDFATLAFPGESFDAFWAAAVFLHVPKREIIEVLTEARRVLASGGVGFISLKQKKQLDEGVIEEAKAGGIRRFFAFYTMDEFAGYARAAGFEIVDSYTQYEQTDDCTWLCYFVRRKD